MIPTQGYAARQAHSAIEPFSFDRRDPGPTDIVIAIEFCGICHSDLHQVNEDWGPGLFPMVPGHEIVGRVRQLGSAVTKFTVGETAGVGCMVDSCRTCATCKSGEEQYCEVATTWTYNSKDRQGRPVFGGYADKIVVDQAFALKISPKLDLAAAAPLLCAGITTYSPLRHWSTGPGKKVGIAGLGGLGHMGLKFAHALGAHVVQFTTSLEKKVDALKLGADEVVLSTDQDALAKHTGSFDLILDTISADHDLRAYLRLLRLDGVHVLVGLPGRPASVAAGDLAMRRRILTGSAIGGIRETQEMFDYCAAQNIVSDIELVQPAQINDAYKRLAQNDVKYRFVIDIAGTRPAR